MPDPHEGVTADGMITTGARRDRCPPAYEPVLARAVEVVGRQPGAVSLYAYGSVPCGTAEVGRSDVDLLSIAIPAGRAADLSDRLSDEFSDLARSVDIAAAGAGDIAAESDEAYGYRVFLRHYCVHLSGPDPAAELPAYPADVPAARGFNGDIGQFLDRWRQRLADDGPSDQLARSVGRKTLLAVAGLVSVHDRIWTTDRQRAATRAAEIWPDLAGGLHELRTLTAVDRISDDQVAALLGPDGTVHHTVDRFDHLIGLWRYL